MIRLGNILFIIVIISACSRKDPVDQMVDHPENKIASTSQMITYISDLINKYPGNPDLYLKKAELNYQLKQWEEAKKSLESFRKLNGENLEADLLIARVAHELGDHDLSLKYAEELFINGYQSVTLNELLFHLYFEEKEYLKAIDQINYALERNPVNFEYLHQKAVCYIQNRDTLNAIVSLEIAIDQGYNSIAALTQYVELLIGQNNQKKALAAINRGLSMDPDNTDLNIAYARLLKNQRQFKRSKGLLFSILHDEQNNYKAYSLLAEIYLDTYMYDSVLYYANRAIRINEVYFPPYFTKAKVFERRQNYYTALYNIEQVLEKDPENPKALIESDKIRNYLSYLQRITKEYENRPVLPLLKPKRIDN